MARAIPAILLQKPSLLQQLHPLSITAISCFILFVSLYRNQKTAARSLTVPSSEALPPTSLMLEELRIYINYPGLFACRLFDLITVSGLYIGTCQNRTEVGQGQGTLPTLLGCAACTLSRASPCRGCLHTSLPTSSFFCQSLQVFQRAQRKSGIGSASLGTLHAA